MINVLLVDDQLLVRSGIESLLSLTDHIRVVAHASNGIETIESLKDHRVDLVLLDIQMPQMDGIETMAEIKASHPALPVIMLTTFDDPHRVQDAIKAGARGYLLKDTSLDDLVDAIDAVIIGETRIQPVAKERVVARLSEVTSRTETKCTEVTEALTEKELQVLRLMASGFSNQEIADAVFRSTGTIKNQVSMILAKLDARDRTRAVLKALQLGII